MRIFEMQAADHRKIDQMRRSRRVRPCPMPSPPSIGFFAHARSDQRHEA
ncbi:hypothetical protein [Caballeronia sp. RCC_10]